MSLRRSRVFAAIGAFATVIAITYAAFSAPITGTYSYDYHTNANSALGINVGNLNYSGSLDATRYTSFSDMIFGEQTFGFNIENGETKTFDLFRIWTNESSIKNNDRNPKNFELSFDFGDFGTFTATGKTFASASDTGRAQGNLVWDNGGIFELGSFGDGILTLSLNDAVFNAGTGSECIDAWFLGCQKYKPDPNDLDGGFLLSSLVTASFRFEGYDIPPVVDPSPVNEPATMAILGLGAAGVAFGARRRKTA